MVIEASWFQRQASRFSLASVHSYVCGLVRKPNLAPLFSMAILKKEKNNWGLVFFITFYSFLTRIAPVQYFVPFHRCFDIFDLAQRTKTSTTNWTKTKKKRPALLGVFVFFLRHNMTRRAKIEGVELYGWNVFWMAALAYPKSSESHSCGGTCFSVFSGQWTAHRVALLWLLHFICLLTTVLIIV